MRDDDCGMRVKGSMLAPLPLGFGQPVFTGLARPTLENPEPPHPVAAIRVQPRLLAFVHPNQLAAVVLLIPPDRIEDITPSTSVRHRSGLPSITSVGMLARNWGTRASKFWAARFGQPVAFKAQAARVASRRLHARGLSAAFSRPGTAFWRKC